MRDNYNMKSEKFGKINDKTLVGGIDVAKDIHEVKWVNWRGEQIGKGLRFNNNRQDFEKLIRQAKQVQEKIGAEKIIMAMEPTGVYGFALEEYLQQIGIDVLIVNGRDVKRTSEVLGNDSSKNDARDARIIGHLVSLGCYSESTRHKEGPYCELDILLRRRASEKEDLIRFTNRLHKELAMLFPEYGVFKNTGLSMGVLTLFKEFGNLEAIIQAGEEGIYACWRKHRTNGYGKGEAKQMHQMAKNSIGIRQTSQAVTYTMRAYIDDYLRSLKNLEAINQLIEQQLAEIPQAKRLMAIDGIGSIITAEILAGIGDIHNFTSPKQILKLAGLAPVTNESGKHKGKDKLSKMGRKRLKTAFYQVGLCLIANNDAFKQIYHYYTQERANPLIKMKGVIVIANKFIRVIYAMLKNGTAYDEQRMLADIQRDDQTAA